MICLTEDDYVRDAQLGRGQAVWVAGLSSGGLVYQDDYRPGLAEPSAWVRLGTHVRETGCRIVRLGLSFRHFLGGPRVFPLPDHCPAYFFCREAFGTLDHPDTFDFFKIGYESGGVLKVQRWQVPDLMAIDEVDRDPSLVPEFLIRNPLG